GRSVQKKFPVLAKVVLKCMLVLMVGAIGASAQVETGAIVGIVRDPSGAVVSDAQITITNTGTNTKETTRSAANRQFVPPLLNVGTYSLSAEKAGFQRFVQNGIKVDVQARVQIDATLQLGTIPQEVQVTAAAPLLDTQTANVGQVVGDRQVS